MSYARYVTDEKFKIGSTVPQKIYCGSNRVKRLLLQPGGTAAAIDYIHKYNDYYTGLTVTLTPRFYVDSSHEYWNNGGSACCSSDVNEGYNDEFSVSGVQLGVSWSETGDSDRKPISNFYIDRAYAYIRIKGENNSYLFEYDGRYYSGNVTNGQFISIPGTYNDRDDTYGRDIGMTFVIKFIVTADGDTFQFSISHGWTTSQFSDDYHAWYTASPYSTKELEVLVTRQEY